MDERTIARFLAKIDRRGADECWPWIGGSRIRGYGWFHYILKPSPRGCLAHRFSWTLENGPIPDGLDILHSCDNPPCCNPGHLSLGTQLENARDMVERGRSKTCGYYVRGESHAKAKVSDADVLYILAARGRERAADLAVRFGVTQHCVWHYWRNNGRTGPKRLRKRMVDQLLPPLNILRRPRA